MQRVRVTQQPWGVRVDLCAPDRRNALDEEAVADLRAVFSADGGGAVLLCGEGPVFCAGGDLAVLGRAARTGGLVDLLVTAGAAFLDLVESIVACPHRVVVAVDGPAVGGGACLALAADVRLATSRARLDLAWGRHGLPPDGGAPALLAALVGEVRAESLLAESATVTAGSELGRALFTAVVPGGRLEAEAIAAAARAGKRPDAAELLADLRGRRESDLAALARAAADEVTSERLSVLYKIDR